MPTWNPRNLQRHHQKRLRTDPGCLEGIFGIPSMITEPQYEAVSHQVVRESWAEFEAQKVDPQYGGYHNASAYFVDDMLVTAITDLSRSRFITCFHEHFGRPHGVVAGPSVSAGQRKLLYRQLLDEKEGHGTYKNVRRKRGV